MNNNISFVLDSNIIAKFVYLPKYLHMDIEEKNGLVLINSGLSSDMFNIVCGIRDNISFSNIFNRFSKMPFAWWIGFDSDNLILKENIKKFGNFFIEVETGMFINIKNVYQEYQCTDLKILPVENKQTLYDFVRVYQTLIPNESKLIEDFYLKSSDYILNLNSPLKFFVGYYNNRPVATSGSFLQNKVVGIWDVVTLPEFRKKGIGSDMTTFALVQARKGCNVAVLTASIKGESIYKKIGFNRIKNYYVFNFLKR